MGLAGGVEHSRLKRVGEWLRLNRGLNPATARAWRRRGRELERSCREDYDFFAHLFMCICNSVFCLYYVGVLRLPDDVQDVKVQLSSERRLALTVSGDTPDGRTISALTSMPQICKNTARKDA